MLRYAVKMYLKEVFKNSTYFMVLGLLILAQYFALTQYKGRLAFVEILQFITVPVYLFLVLIVFFTEDKVLTFELVLFRNWPLVALARLLSLLISLVPFIVVTALLAGTYGSGDLIVPALSSVLFYGTLVLLLTTFGGGSKAYVISMGILFLLPFSSMALIQTQASLGTPPHGFMGYLAYLLSPVYGRFSVSSGTLLVDSRNANYVTLALSGLWSVIYLVAFSKRNLHPSG